MPLFIAQDAFNNVPAQDAERLLAKIQWLWDNRQQTRHDPLKENLRGFYKRRVGKYRIIYTYETNPDDMKIHLIGTRDAIYKQIP